MNPALTADKGEDRGASRTSARQESTLQSKTLSGLSPPFSGSRGRVRRTAGKITLELLPEDRPAGGQPRELMRSERSVRPSAPNRLIAMTMISASVRGGIAQDLHVDLVELPEPAFLRPLMLNMGPIVKSLTRGLFW